MSKLDWSKAPEWATVALRYENGDSIDFAEAFKDGSRVYYSDEVRETTIVDKCDWEVIEYRNKEKERDKAIREMSELAASLKGDVTDRDLFEALYDAGWRKND